MSLSELIAAGSLAWLALTLVQSGARSFRSQLADPDGQLLGLVTSVVATGVYVALLSLDLRLPLLAAAGAAGIAAGYFISRAAGFEEVAGLSVMRGSGLFLITWGVAAFAAVSAALAQEPDLLAASLIATVASLGAQAGQFGACLQSVLAIENGAPEAGVTAGS